MWNNVQQLSPSQSVLQLCGISCTMQSTHRPLFILPQWRWFYYNQTNKNKKQPKMMATLKQQHQHNGCVGNKNTVNSCWKNYLISVWIHHHHHHIYICYFLFIQFTLLLSILLVNLLLLFFMSGSGNFWMIKSHASQMNKLHNA